MASGVQSNLKSAISHSTVRKQACYEVLACSSSKENSYLAKPPYLSGVKGTLILAC